jgi:hypothetical protein
MTIEQIARLQFKRKGNFHDSYATIDEDGKLSARIYPEDFPDFAIWVIGLVDVDTPPKTEGENVNP